MKWPKSAIYVEGCDKSEADEMRLWRMLAKAELTRAELRCLAGFYFDGHTQKEIAALLGIPPRTVCNHLGAGKAKLVRHGMAIKRLEQQDHPTITNGADLDAVGIGDVRAKW